MAPMSSQWFQRVPSLQMAECWCAGRDGSGTSLHPGHEARADPGQDRNEDLKRWRFARREVVFVMPRNTRFQVALYLPRKVDVRLHGNLGI